MAPLFKKLRKLTRDPIAYCMDSKHPFLKAHGERLFARQTERYKNLGAANAHRKITVVMTAYNTGHLVAKAVRSVLAQSHENLELMVIDDTSNDNTLDVLKELAATDKRMRVFHSPVNHGTYWSKNWCLSQADGEFVAFHDSDDRSDPMRLQVQLGAMLDGNGVDTVTCHWRRVDAEDNPLVIDGTPSRMAAISLMIRREEILQKTGFFDAVRISADTEFLRRLHRTVGPARMKTIRQILYTGLLRDDSLTRGENSGFRWEVNGNSYVREVNGDRAAYHNAFLDWHARNENNPVALRIDFPIAKRNYTPPERIARACDDQDTKSVIEVTAAGTNESVAV